MSGTERYFVTRVGSQNEPVVVIDAFHPEFEALRSAAQEADFSRLSPHYPGVQAPADPQHLACVGELLTEILRDVFGIANGARLIQCAYSLVTTPEAELTAVQSVPHVDTPDAGRIALLHYLSPAETGGTAFYRHRATGLDTLSPETFPAFADALKAEPAPEPRYMRGSTERFERIHAVEAAPNRAVLYRSRLLHSGMIPEGARLSDDPAVGRLTLNSFFQAK